MKLDIRVKPGCKSPTRLEKQSDGSYVAFLQARAHDGEANQALIRLLAAEFDCPKSQITVVRGAKSRQKIIEISE